jgi:hypothetical protein
MTIEPQLRAALRERAAPIHASPALLATDYRPRTRRLRAPVAIGGGLTTTAAAVTAAVLLLTDGASNAFAGWTPRPSVPTKGQIADARSGCAGHLAFPGLPLQLTDTRGPFAFQIYSDATTTDFCITGPSFASSSGFRFSPAPVVPAGALGPVSTSSPSLGGQTYGYLISRAGADVTAATLTLDDATDVTATVSNGWAVAWWPGSHQVTAAQVTTPAGTHTQAFAPAPCALHNCAGGPHGGSASGGPGGG